MDMNEELKEYQKKRKKKVRFINILSACIMTLSIYGLCTNTYDFTKYFSYVGSEIRFINKHGMSYKFKDEKHMPKTEGPAFFIKPPIDKKGEFEIFIAEEVHQDNKFFLGLFGFCELMYTIGLAGSVWTLVKLNHRSKDIVTGKRIQKD